MSAQLFSSLPPPPPPLPRWAPEDSGWLVVRCLQTSAASMRTLLTFFIEHLFLDFLRASKAETMSPSPPPPHSGLRLPFFGGQDLTLLMWREDRGVPLCPPPLPPRLTWQSFIFGLAVHHQDACPCSICLCLSDSVNPALFPRFHQFTTLALIP